MERNCRGGEGRHKLKPEDKQEGQIHLRWNFLDDLCSEKTLKVRTQKHRINETPCIYCEVLNFRILIMYYIELYLSGLRVFNENRNFLARNFLFLIVKYL